MSKKPSDYQEFLRTKMVYAQPCGFDCGPINPLAKPFQADIIRWALRRGRAAILADTGLGKTFMQLEWSRHVIDYGGRAGGGMHIPVADIDGDGDLDFAVGGKSGLFLFENLTKGRRTR